MRALWMSEGLPGIREFRDRLTQANFTGLIPPWESDGFRFVDDPAGTTSISQNWDRWVIEP
jgi:hypothetical protein